MMQDGISTKYQAKAGPLEWKMAQRGQGGRGSQFATGKLEGPAHVTPLLESPSKAVEGRVRGFPSGVSGTLGTKDWGSPWFCAAGGENSKKIDCSDLGLFRPLLPVPPQSGQCQRGRPISRPPPAEEVRATAARPRTNPTPQSRDNPHPPPPKTAPICSQTEPPCNQEKRGRRGG